MYEQKTVSILNLGNKAMNNVRRVAGLQRITADSYQCMTVWTDANNIVRKVDTVMLGTVHLMLKNVTRVLKYGEKRPVP